MGFIALDYFRNSPLLAMPVIALVIFMLVFVAVTLRAFSGKTSRWDEVSRLPLEGAEPTRGEGGRE